MFGAMATPSKNKGFADLLKDDDTSEASEGERPKGGTECFYSVCISVHFSGCVFLNANSQVCNNKLFVHICQKLKVCLMPHNTVLIVAVFFFKTIIQCLLYVKSGSPIFPSSDKLPSLAASSSSGKDREANMFLYYS